jgi:hypothetical protein|uniref:Uncharacterized protein n=1 Tax=Attheya septentrionalis TaxID=420275 RepID=A0A7S2UE55_9STRA|mmetsp:Transcript_18780/g.34055  ORF Transcript_18780/g.34055 Transcript_18780/m.34055 type:complete len:106 (+) Transcript_18780:282-599(+)
MEQESSSEIPKSSSLPSVSVLPSLDSSYELLLKCSDEEQLLVSFHRSTSLSDKQKHKKQQQEYDDREPVILLPSKYNSNATQRRKIMLIQNVEKVEKDNGRYFLS